jgi:hypothetical protein
MFLEGIYNYNFVTDGSNVVPYVGAAGGLSLSKSSGQSQSSFEYGGQAGIKSFISESFYVNYEARIRLYSDSGIDTTTTSLNIGMNYLFD